MKNNINGVFEIDKTYESNSWLKAKLSAFAFGENRNASDIKAESFNDYGKAKSSILGIPIVAKYNKELDDLEGHNVELEKNESGEYEYHYDTEPFGFVSPNAKVSFEQVNEGDDLNPQIKTYVVADEVFLWKRYGATKKIMEWSQEGIPAKVSMEIDNIQGKFSESGYFEINDFTFEAICALGSEVEPCFPKAEIKMYSANDFKKDLKSLMAELKFNLDENILTKGGKEEVEEIKNTPETEFETVEELKKKQEKEQSQPGNPEAPIIEELIEPIEPIETLALVDDAPVVETPVTETPVTETPVVETTPTDGDGGDGGDGGTFSITKEEYELTVGNLQKEVEALRAYKRTRELGDLQEKFSAQLDEKEIKDLFESKSDATIEALETEIFALIGKKNYSLEPVEKKNKQPIPIVSNNNKDSNPYGDIFN